MSRRFHAIEEQETLAAGARSLQRRKMAGRTRSGGDPNCAMTRWPLERFTNLALRSTGDALHGRPVRRLARRAVRAGAAGQLFRSPFGARVAYLRPKQMPGLNELATTSAKA